MMWPICALGITTVAIAVRFAVSGCNSWLPLARASSACTILCGAFGTTIGWMRVLSFAGVRFRERPFTMPEGSDETVRFMILAEGGREALTCVAASLLFAALTAFVVAWGLGRRPKAAVASLSHSV